MEEAKVKVTNLKTNYFWLAGWMFTMGTGAYEELFSAAMVWYKMIVTVIASYLFWPMVLGELFIELFEKLI